ncbi:MAG: hypothetical protein IPH07_07575 [Deltaproteobacteria bacterium]|nr:hypothetical protein [Deltaproteobacteria bacterium]MBK8236598.1 hypothetical protein [Deltaproteobacteria bacterium]MBP7288827.1 hypothetical protein [Nannocystaceae bacterium]
MGVVPSMFAPRTGTAPGVRSWIVRAALGCTLAWAGPAASAHAELMAPFAGSGASTPEPKDKGDAAVRQRALAKARKAALTAALDQLGAELPKGSIDKSARKAVLKAADSWTGAYRVLSEREDAGAVSIEIEADIDLARLRKRLVATAPSDRTALYSAAGVQTSGPCGTADAASTRVEDELAAAGATGKDGVPLSLSLTCTALGAVPHTFSFAARVELIASVDGRALRRVTKAGFGADAEAAVQAAVVDAAATVATALAQHRRGIVTLQVRGAQPAKLRRLERALLQSVAGVSAVELAAVARGGVVSLRVEGVRDAQALAQALQSLQSPGLHSSPPTIEGPDALSIELQ